MPTTTPLHFLLLTFAGWVNRQQRGVVEYLREENRVLREQLDGPVAFAGSGPAS